MAFNQLLWEFAHIFLHPWLVSDASISQFDWRLVNQQRQMTDCVLKLFDSSKYLTTLRSNISPCQKAVTLILISFYNPSSHLWKPKKYLGTTAFFSWMPFKICDCDKFLSTIPVTQFCFRRSLDQINLHFLALYTRWLIKKGEKCEKLSRFL